MGVDRHPVAHLAAQQPPDRQAERLAEDIPQRHLDAGDGAHADGAEPPEAVLGQGAIGLLDVAGVEPDQQRRQVIDTAAHGAGLPLQRRLAPAMEARLVGIDAYEDPVAEPRVDDMGGDGSDLHGHPLVVATATGKLAGRGHRGGSVTWGR